MGLKAAPVVERWCAYAPTPRRSGEDSPLRRAALTFGLAERPARIEHVAPPRRAPVHPGAGAAAAFLRAKEVAAVQCVARNHAVTAATAAPFAVPALALAKPFGDRLRAASLSDRWHNRAATPFLGWGDWWIGGAQICACPWDGSVRTNLSRRAALISGGPRSLLEDPAPPRRWAPVRPNRSASIWLVVSRGRLFSPAIRTFPGPSQTRFWEGALR